MTVTVDDSVVDYRCIFTDQQREWPKIRATHEEIKKHKLAYKLRDICSKFLG